MESLAILLEPHTDIIVIAASYATYLHQLSGALVCNNIRKQKSTIGHSIMPFLAGFVISALMARFGLLINDGPTINVSFFGIALNIIYICLYFSYTNNIKDKTLAWTQMGYGFAITAAIFAYTYMENPKDLPFRLGMILTAVLFYFVGSPLLSLGEFIRNKSTEGLPFPIILSGTVISLLWLLYGIVSREMFMIFQNGGMFIMSAIQLSLFAIYPSKPAKQTKSGAGSPTNNNDKKKN